VLHGRGQRTGLHRTGLVPGEQVRVQRLQVDGGGGDLRFLLAPHGTRRIPT